MDRGTKSVFRILQGSVAVIFGAAIVMGGLLHRWIGGLGILAGVATIIFGVGIGYVGFANPPIVGDLSTCNRQVTFVPSCCIQSLDSPFVSLYFDARAATKRWE